nr:uroporphyrinogen-III synthase [Variovorax ginsengisoli]
MPVRRLIVTRPAAEAARWVQALREAGIDAVALPLIDIAPVQDDRALCAARDRQADYDALMFVSASAVSHFFGGTPDRTSDRPFMLRTGPAAAYPRCWSTGPGTARALREAGVPAAAIDTPGQDAGQFDSEALWAVVRPQIRPGTRVLIVRGGDAAGLATGRDWLARQIASEGGEVDTAVAYRRLAPAFGAAERALAAEGASGRARWLFSSSEAIGNLRLAMPAQTWGAACALATHARIAQAARDAGFGVVCGVPAGLPALIASIESLA